MKYMSLFRKFLPHLVSVVLIWGVLAAYFSPQLGGKVVAGGDFLSAKAWSNHIYDFRDKTGKDYHWNPAMFSGMPWGLLALGKDDNLTRPLDRAFALWQNAPLGLAFQAAILCYLSLILLGIRPWIALISSLIFSLNLNYLILIEAGHNNKLNVIAYFPLIISGLILCYRERYKWGAPVIALSTSLALARNHPQMVYYLLMILVVFGLIFGVSQILEKKGTLFFKSSAIALAAALIGGLANFSQLDSARSFAEDTMRGEPILTTSTDDANSSSNVEGLNWNYAMQWSNDTKDLLTLFVPRLVGGSSYEEVKATSDMGRLLSRNNSKLGSDNTYRAQMYWGGLPSTSGPYYSGVIVFIIALLAFKILDKSLIWALAGSILFLTLMSMGKNAAWLNHTFFDHLPYFNKWRAPSSAITLLPVFIVIIFGLTLDRLLQLKKSSTVVRPLLISGGIITGICLLIGLLGPSMLSFEGARDAAYNVEILNIFKGERAAMLTGDAYRGVVLGLFCTAVLFFFLKGKLKNGLAVVCLIGVVAILDQFSIGKRHLDSDNFESKREFENNYAPRSVDQQIASMEPNGRGYYRVFDQAGFRDAMPSYHHNTIGGYHPAKLQRYQDIIDSYILKGQANVINMLNTKYIIGGDQQLQVNGAALGNAWFVQDVKSVNGPDEEFNAINGLNTANTAVVNIADFPPTQYPLVPGNAEGSITLTSYEPDKLTYQSESSSAQMAVFSEVWFDVSKGLAAYIDGEPANFVRTNYILRGLQIPSGAHKIEFVFDPRPTGSIISLLASGLILLSILYLLFIEGRKWKLEPATVATNAESKKVKKKKIKKKKK